MREKERVILLGGTGFLGRALGRELRDRGVEIVTVARGSRGTERPDYCLDLSRENDGLRGILSSGDTVVYLLGLSPLRRPLGGRRAYRIIHLTALRRVLSLAEGAGVRRLVYLSALGVSRSAGAAYAETKAAAEAALERSPLSTTVVAPSILFGLGSEIVSALNLLSKIPALPMPRIDAPVRPIHVSDAARRIADEILAGASASRLELVGPDELTFTEVVRRYLGPRGVRLLPLPSAVSRFLIRLTSPLKVPGLPSEIEAMLAMDNAGSPPENPEGMIRFGEWAMAGCRLGGRGDRRRE